MFRSVEGYSFIISTVVFALVPMAIVGLSFRLGGRKAARIAGFILIAISIGLLAFSEFMFWQSRLNPQSQIVDGTQVTNVGRVAAAIAAIIFWPAIINIVATGLSMGYFSRVASDTKRT